jgi:SAM-dependent methyltransferase
MGTSRTIPVDPGNADALAAWDGDDGAFWAEHESVFDRSVHRYRDPLLDAMAVRPGDRVLDVGCGNGGTTVDAARASGTGRVLGVDLSSRMLERARRRAADAGLANVEVVQGDAQVHPFPAGAFDLAVSRTGTMFFADPVAAFANIGRALRAEGRLVMLVWQDLAHNEWIRELRAVLAAGRDLPVPPPDAPGPFSLADPDRTRAVLGDAGLVDVDLDDVRRPLWFGADAASAYAFLSSMGLSRFLLSGLSAEAREAALAGLRADIEAHAGPDGVLYDSAAWIVTAQRP